MEIEDFKNLIVPEFEGCAVLSIDENATPKALIINSEDVLKICGFLKDSDQTFFDLLSCLTVIDNGVDTQSMEVIYNMYSIPFEHSLMIKVAIDRAEPKVDSVSSLWQTANWHEREAFDLFGVDFVGHPDLRRIFMPADWEGHPMQKDYVEPDTYRGMKTIREEGDPS